MEPSTYHCCGRRRSQAALIGRIKEIAATRVRYGYRRIQVLVRREGWHVNAKRIYRLYRDLAAVVMLIRARAPGARPAQSLFSVATKSSRPVLRSQAGTPRGSLISGGSSGT
ncbi:IS3 family transposase [Neoroseomonas rubea]|uniref:IS3 family transposase n=1 Tax=Neoroseomonas rubea TaxID=2748666 RepID=UPI0038CD7DB2